VFCEIWISYDFANEVSNLLRYSAMKINVLVSTFGISEELLVSSFREVLASSETMLNIKIQDSPKSRSLHAVEFNVSVCVL